MTPQEALVYLAANPNRRVHRKLGSDYGGFDEFRLSPSVGLEYRNSARPQWVTGIGIHFSGWSPGPYVGPSSQLPEEIEQAARECGHHTEEYRVMARVVLAECEKRYVKLE